MLGKPKSPLVDMPSRTFWCLHWAIHGGLTGTTWSYLFLCETCARDVCNLPSKYSLAKKYNTNNFESILVDIMRLVYDFDILDCLPFVLCCR